MAALALTFHFPVRHPGVLESLHLEFSEERDAGVRSRHAKPGDGVLVTVGGDRSNQRKATCFS